MMIPVVLAYLCSIANASSIASFPIQGCGNFVVEGYLSSEGSLGKELILTVEKGSRSAIHFRLKNPKSIELKNLIKTNIRAELRVDEKCLYSCSATLVEIRKALDPFEKPQSLTNSKLNPFHRQFDCKKD